MYIYYICIYKYFPQKEPEGDASIDKLSYSFSYENKYTDIDTDNDVAIK